MYTVYLAGSITTDKRTYAWREKVRNHYKGHPYVKIIDPCSSEFNLQYHRKRKSLQSQYSSNNTVVLLPHKDLHYVRISNVIIVDLNIYTPEKPPTGTLFELAWAFEDPSKMVIGIFHGDPKKDRLCSHPFVSETIQTWVNSELEACDLLDHYLDILEDELESIEEGYE